MDEPEPNGVPGLVGRDRLTQGVDRGDVLAVDRDDHVSAELVALAGDDDLRVAALDAGLGRRAARLDGADEDAFRCGEAEDAGDVGLDSLERDAEERAVDPPVVEQLGDDAS